MDCARNIITANFSGGKTHATTARAYQWSRGIELCITGADNLPQTFKAHFSVQKRGGVATTIVGIDERVDVPNVLFTIGKDIHVWLGASETEDDAEILYTVDIPVAPAPMPEYYDAEDTGVFDAVVEQVADYAATATAAANSAGASATAAAGSASAAAASASSAAGSAGAAEQARADAVTAKGQAETAAQTATEKAQQTAQNASQAALDAGRAESAAERAESAETGAGAAKTAAEAAAQSAAASAATADEKATLAGQSATAAAGSASAAAQSAASIEGDVQIASQKASEAQTAAGQAVTAKDAAVTAQQGAETAATNAGQSASTATAKAAEAATSASNAAQSKTDAEAAAARAEQAAATLTVDSALSDSSTNPVQNKVITGEITDVKTALEAVEDWVAFQDQTPAVPAGMRSANYESGHYAFKYSDKRLIIRYNNTSGSTFKPRCAYGFASLELSDIGVNISDNPQNKYVQYSTTLTTSDVATAKPRMVFYFAKADYSVTKVAIVSIPTGTRNYNVNIADLASENNIPIATYPMFVIVGVDGESFTATSDYNCVAYIDGLYETFTSLAETVEALEQEIGDNTTILKNHESSIALGSFANRFKPCMDHLFVTKVRDAVVIPSESIYHVRISRRFGFNMIEGNIYPTSDGVFIVNHLASGGKFGGYFHHVDGTTDISNILVSSVTWDWIVQNVRYNSQIPKFRTRPCRLEEFLSECRQQNLIPFIAATNPDVIRIADEYMGKNNYIAYAANRANCPSAIISHWQNLETKDEILNYCRNIGVPFIYSMANPQSFTDAELTEIINALHAEGFWIGTSYDDVNWYKYKYLGFDFDGSQRQINRIDCGNLYNLDAAFGFSDFTFTNADESNGVLTFTADGTISPNVNVSESALYAVDLQVDFTGTITIPGKGEWSGPLSFQSDGTIPFFAAIPIINGNPNMTISVASGTVIKNISYKVSKV